MSFSAPHLGSRRARVRGGRARLAWGWTVERTKPDGSLDWYTLHHSKLGARLAVWLYERYGWCVGTRP